MKAGRSLQKALMELEYQNKAKKDYIAPAQDMKLERDGRTFLMGTQTPFATILLFHHQPVSAPSIPMKCYDLMWKEKSELLAENVNAQLGTRQNNYMTHLIDYGIGPVARALLSEQYRWIDNMEITSAVLLLFAGNDGYSVESYEVTEHRSYLKTLNRRLEIEVRKGDIVRAGATISNSGVGLGAVSVQSLVHRLVCLNRLIIFGCGERRNYASRQAEVTEDLTLYSNGTLQAEDRAFLLKLRNTIMTTVEESRLAQVVDRLKEATGTSIKDNVQEAVELIGREFGIMQEEQDGIFRYLAEGGDPSLYGLTNAVTWMSQNMDSYDWAVALEWVGW